MAPTRDRAGTGPVIRVATLDDVAAIGVLHARSQRTAYADLLPPEALSRIDDGEWILTWTQRLGSAGTRAVLVAERHQDLLGLALTTRQPTPWAILDALHVDPASYREGLGTALHDAVIEQARCWGRARMRLSVLRANSRARLFYERHGWQLGGRGDDHAIAGHAVETVRYILDLLHDHVGE